MQAAVLHKPGDLRIVSSDGTVSDPIDGVPDVNDSGQGGLLDVMPDRDFAANNTIYLSYSEPGRSGDSGTAVARATLSGTRLENLQVIFRQQPKSRGGRHFGSRLVQAPDGTLLITIGDRGERSGEVGREQVYQGVVEPFLGGGQRRATGQVRTCAAATEEAVHQYVEQARIDRHQRRAAPGPDAQEIQT